jgi:hypothetical protein
MSSRATRPITFSLADFDTPLRLGRQRIVT